MIYYHKEMDVYMKLEKQGAVNTFKECDKDGNPANLKMNCRGELTPQTYLTTSFKNLELCTTKKK